MNNYPLVSIIMGIYNCADTLDEAIKSIINQTYTNWELIMCDDCSSDNTYNLALKYCKQFPNKIILIKNDENLGLNQTLNNCLHIAKGEYIARMDGDDISLPERLEKEVFFLNSNPGFAITSCQMEYFDECGTFGRGKRSGEPKKNDFVKGTPFCHAPCMVRKSAYDAVGGYSVSNWLLRAEDYHLWIKMYAKGYKGYNLPEVLYRMRDDRNAITRRKYKYRINEAYVICCAIKMLDLNVLNYIYIFRPLIIGLLPKRLYKFLHYLRNS